MGKDKSNKEKLRELEEQNEKLCEDIAVYQNICVDELCDEYANILSEGCEIDKDNALSLLSALAGEIQRIYFD